MASDEGSPVLTVDIVCGTLQAKLNTKDLSSGSSPCILFGSRLLTPCDFQRLAGKASARNWKTSIRCLDQPLSRFLESYKDTDGKRCCRVIDTIMNCSSTASPRIQANSQPPGMCQPPSMDSAHPRSHSQHLLPTVPPSSQSSDLTDSPSTDHPPSHPPEPVHFPSDRTTRQSTTAPVLPAFQPVTEPYGGPWTLPALFTPWMPFIRR